MAWYLAPSLTQLRSEVNARWPGRDRASDGAVGDTSHAARLSDHNPDWADGGVVRAIDVDEDGIPTALLLREAITDPRVNYVIYESLIYTRANGFRPAPYRGPNPHDKHMHISLRHGTQWENDRSPWITDATLASHTTPTPGVDIPTPAGVLPGPLQEDDMFSDDDAQRLQVVQGQLDAVLEALRIPDAPYQYPEATLAAVQEVHRTVSTIQGQGDAVLGYLRGPGDTAGDLSTGNLDALLAVAQATEARVIALDAAVRALATRQGLDPDAVVNAAREGDRRALESLTGHGGRADTGLA